MAYSRISRGYSSFFIIVINMILCFRFDAILFFVFFSPSSIAITSLGEEKANLSAFRKFVRFVLVWICWFSFPLGVCEELRFVILELSGLFYYLFFLLY